MPLPGPSSFRVRVRVPVLERQPQVERELRGVKQRIARRVDAITVGGPVEELVERLKAERAHKAALVEEQRVLNGRDGERQVR